MTPLHTFKDERGSISHFLQNADVLQATSVKGTRRANHYHKASGHLLLIVSGSLHYYERPVGSTEKPAVKAYGPGEYFWSGPMLEHQMVFDEDTAFWFFSTGCRNQADYEADLVRLPFQLCEQ